MITTRYGNKYSEAEWAEMMGNWDAEIAQIQDELDQADKAQEIAIDMLVATGQFNEATRPQLRAAVYRNYSVEFSTQAKAEAAQPIFDWYNSKI